jgi:histidyl-tRNA synthetase
VSPQFRHGRPQAGRLREFRQFGVETIGSAAPKADVEIVALGDRFLRARGLERIELRINSIGDAECRPAYREKLIAYLEPHQAELDEDCRTRLRTNPLRVFDCKVDGQTPLVLGAPLISDNLCQGLRRALRGRPQRAWTPRGSPSHTIPGSSEGSTTTRGRRSSSSRPRSPRRRGRCAAVAATTDSPRCSADPPTPGVGFALGLDRLVLAMREEGAALPGQVGLACFVVSIGTEATELGERLVDELRNAGIPAATTLEDRSLKAQLRLADRSGAAYALILGEREVTAGTAILKSLAGGEQEEIPIGDVVNWLSRTDWAAER